MYLDRTDTKTGFTLIELMIVVAIVSILTVIAIPTYTSYVLRSNRIAAKSFLNAVARDEQRYYIVNRSYGKLSALRPQEYKADTISIDENQKPGLQGAGLYDVTVTATATTFTITANAKNRQSSDTDCLTFTLDNTGKKSPDACWNR